jgi:hypothetical protein
MSNHVTGWQVASAVYRAEEGRFGPVASENGFRSGDRSHEREEVLPSAWGDGSGSPVPHGSGLSIHRMVDHTWLRRGASLSLCNQIDDVAAVQADRPAPGSVCRLVRLTKHQPLASTADHRIAVPHRITRERAPSPNHETRSPASQGGCAPPTNSY